MVSGAGLTAQIWVTEERCPSCAGFAIQQVKPMADDWHHFCKFMFSNIYGNEEDAHNAANCVRLSCSSLWLLKATIT